MDAFKHLQALKTHYANGGNLMQYLRDLDQRSTNTVEDILISYDFQAGSYVKGYCENRVQRDQYCGQLAGILTGLGPFNSLLEAGVGEATTLANVLRQLPQRPAHALGFDISWSRLQYGRAFVRSMDAEPVTLFTGDLFRIPLADNAVDIVYTSHSVEPNGGREADALRELYRVARRYVVLLEPAYELASDAARQRMTAHGYVTNLLSTAQQLGYTVREHRLIEPSQNPLNPTGLLLIEKDASAEPSRAVSLACPITGARLTDMPDSLFAEDSLLAYPKIQGIPCLLAQNAILATHFMTLPNNYAGNDL